MKIIEDIFEEVNNEIKEKAPYAMRKYQKINSTIRQQLINKIYLEKKTIKKAAQEVNINYSSAKTILNQYRKKNGNSLPSSCKDNLSTTINTSSCTQSVLDDMEVPSNNLENSTFESQQQISSYQLQQQQQQQQQPKRFSNARDILRKTSSAPQTIGATIQPIQIPQQQQQPQINNNFFGNCQQQNNYSQPPMFQLNGSSSPNQMAIEREERYQSIRDKRQQQQNLKEQSMMFQHPLSNIKIEEQEQSKLLNKLNSNQQQQQSLELPKLPQMTMNQQQEIDNQRENYERIKQQLGIQFPNQNFSNFNFNQFQNMQKDFNQFAQNYNDQQMFQQPEQQQQQIIDSLKNDLQLAGLQQQQMIQQLKQQQEKEQRMFASYMALQYQQQFQNEMLYFLYQSQMNQMNNVNNPMGIINNNQNLINQQAQQLLMNNNNNLNNINNENHIQNK